MTGTDRFWNPERVKKLTKLWTEGYSAALIAKEIPGSTKNSVIGRVHRMQLPGRKPRKILPYFRREKIMAQVKIKQPPRPAKHRNGVPFMEADSTTCRSIQGRSTDKWGHTLALFCPKPKAVQESFCPHHLSIYYTRSHR